MPTFQQVQRDADNRKLIRKIQKAVAFLGRADVELPESLYQGGSLIDLKAEGWLPVGIVTPDGYSFAREPESEDIDGLGYASPVRSDTTRVARSVTFTPLESGRKHMYELRYGTDLSGVTQDATTGEIVFDEPDLPVDAEYKLLVLGSDGPADENWVMGKGYFSAKVSGTAEEVWGREGAVSSQITLNIFSGEESGVPVRHFIGGTGAVKHKDVLGFDTDAGGAEG